MNAPATSPPSVPLPHPEFEQGVLLQGTYRILERLAIGGMGEVYAATHERLAGRLAVKVLQRELATNDESFARFKREATIMARLQHPNVAHVVDFNVTEQGTPYLVMELLEGRDLQQVLDAREPLSLARVAAIVRQIASALDAAHQQGVIHRDLKPENVILLSVGGNEAFVKVIDFGISKVMYVSTRLTKESGVLGTPQYMAPEQAQGRIELIDHRTDEFALAAMTYAMLTGREPFTGDSPLSVLYQVVHTEPPALAGLVEWPSDPVEAVLRRALSKQPDGRYGNVMDFSRALDEAVAAVLAESGKIPVTANAVPTVAGDTGELLAIADSRPLHVPPRRRRWPLVVGVVALLAGAGTAAYRYAPPATRDAIRGGGATTLRAATTIARRGWDTARRWIGR